MKKTKLTFLIAIFAVLILPLTVWRGMQILVSPVSATDGELQAFVVEKGDSIAKIGINLKQAGLIRSPFAFRMLVTTRSMTLQAGEYALSPSMTTAEIAEELTHGTFDYKLTIIEGWRVEEIAHYISSELGISAADFINNAEEGYMFPETYFVPKDIDAQQLAGLMKNTFNEKITEQMVSDLKKQDLTLSQAVILASIVEREVNTDAGRPVVAGILLKRLREDWPLEADATIQYAVANQNNQSSRTGSSVPKQSVWWPKNLTQADLEVDSPYNTRRYKGLPPTAICNPGLASIQAVIYPKFTDYWFYITGNDGNMYYAETVEEHNENVARHLR